MRRRNQLRQSFGPERLTCTEVSGRAYATGYKLRVRTRRAQAACQVPPLAIQRLRARITEGLIAAANSRRVDPNARRDLISRSALTVGSAASIFATRDWLDPRTLASSIWDSFRRRRRSRSFCASDSFISTYADSAGDRPRKSAALPTLQPASSRRPRFARCTLTPLPPSRSPRADAGRWRPRPPACAESACERPRQSRPHPRRSDTRYARTALGR